MVAVMVGSTQCVSVLSTDTSAGEVLLLLDKGPSPGASAAGVQVLAYLPPSCMNLGQLVCFPVVF